MNKTKLEIALSALNEINSGYITAGNRDKVDIAESALNKIKKIETEEKGILKINIDSIEGIINFNNFTESQLAAIIENAIVAINKKKAERQGETVDVGFWDNKGEYIEDLQAISPEEKAEIFEYFEKTGGGYKNGKNNNN